MLRDRPKLARKLWAALAVFWLLPLILSVSEHDRGMTVAAAFFVVLSGAYAIGWLGPRPTRDPESESSTDRSS